MDLTCAITWRKASRSGNSGGNCVEVGISTNSSVVLVRDSKNREVGHLTVTREAFARFLRELKSLQPKGEPPSASSRRGFFAPPGEERGVAAACPGGTLMPPVALSL